MSEPASFYRYHVFFCCNQRDGGRACCNDKGATTLRDYCKKQVGKAGLAGVGKVRINQAGCLDRCEEGPVVVIYPEAVWYRYANEADIEEIIESHLRNDQVVQRLKI